MRLDRKGISPVVGTILLVSVTVIIAGVVAAFAMGLGRPTAPPTVNLSLEILEDNKNAFYIYNGGGDTVDDAPGILSVRLNGSSISRQNIKVAGKDNNLGVGEGIKVSSNYSKGDELTVVHKPSNSILLESTIETSGMGNSEIIINETSFERIQSNDPIGYSLENEDAIEDVWGRVASLTHPVSWYIAAQDTDGEARIIFDSVDVSEYDNVWISFWINSEGDMESDDEIGGYVKVDNEGSWTEFFSVSGDSIPSDYTEKTYSFDDNVGSVKMKIIFKNSANDEYFYLDDVTITGNMLG